VIDGHNIISIVKLDAGLPFGLFSGQSAKFGLFDIVCEKQSGLAIWPFFWPFLNVDKNSIF